LALQADCERVKSFLTKEKVFAAFRSTICSAAPTPHPQHRKINCTLQNALAEKAAWWAAM